MVSKARIRAIGEYFKKLLFKMEKENKDPLKKEAKNVEVQILPQQMREDGLILFKFNQKLILPEFVKRIKQGRLLAGTELIKSFSQINVAQSIAKFELQINSDAAPYDFQYYAEIIDWTENNIMMKISFKEPLAIS